MSQQERAKLYNKNQGEMTTMPDFLYDKRISHSMKIEIEKGLAHYAVKKSLIFDSRPWRLITFQDILPSLELQHDRWKRIDPKTINSGTQTGTLQDHTVHSSVPGRL